MGPLFWGPLGLPNLQYFRQGLEIRAWLSAWSSTAKVVPWRLMVLSNHFYLDCLYLGVYNVDNWGSRRPLRETVSRVIRRKKPAVLPRVAWRDTFS